MVVRCVAVCSRGVVLWRGGEVGALSCRVVSVSGNQLLRMTKHGCREFCDFSDGKESTRATWDTLAHEHVQRIVSYKVSIEVFCFSNLFSKKEVLQFFHFLIF